MPSLASIGMVLPSRSQETFGSGTPTILTRRVRGSPSRNFVSASPRVNDGGSTVYLKENWSNACTCVISLQN